jgi:hypothetical protein
LGSAPRETKLVLRLALRQRLYLGCECYQFRTSTYFIQKAVLFTESCMIPASVPAAATTFQKHIPSGLES